MTKAQEIEKACAVRDFKVGDSVAIVPHCYGAGSQAERDLVRDLPSHFARVVEVRKFKTRTKVMLDDCTSWNSTGRPWERSGGYTYPTMRHERADDLPRLKAIDAVVDRAHKLTREKVAAMSDAAFANLVGALGADSE